MSHLSDTIILSSQDAFDLDHQIDRKINAMVKRVAIEFILNLKVNLFVVCKNNFKIMHIC